MESGALFGKKFEQTTRYVVTNTFYALQPSGNKYDISKRHFFIFDISICYLDTGDLILFYHGCQSSLNTENLGDSNKF